MARQAVPKRAAPDSTLKVGEHDYENPIVKAGADLPGTVKAVVRDITTGSQQLLHMGAAAAAKVRERYQRMKAFVGDR